MNEKKQYNLQNVTSRSLKAALRGLSDIDFPDTLKARLIAAIPDNCLHAPRRHCVQWYFKTWGLGTAIAAVLLFVLILVVTYGSILPAGGSVIDWNDRPTDLNDRPVELINKHSALQRRTMQYAMADQNNIGLASSALCVP
ncbi:MAG: hypothetical protein ABIG61_16980 [Planctomycetota bacterium]